MRRDEIGAERQQDQQRDEREPDQRTAVLTVCPPELAHPRRRRRFLREDDGGGIAVERCDVAFRDEQGLVGRAATHGGCAD